MTRTYISASDRDSKRYANLNARFHSGHFLLALTSIVSMFVIGLAYAGRLHAFDASAQPSQTINLNAVTESKELEPALERVFTDISYRQSAARALFDFAASGRRLRGPEVQF